MYINTLYLVVFISFVVKYVNANLGIFGFNGFESYTWIRSEEEVTEVSNIEYHKNKCYTWHIENTESHLSEQYASLTINPGCSKGLTMTYNSEIKFYSVFQYYSEIEIDLYVSVSLIFFF